MNRNYNSVGLNNSLVIYDSDFHDALAVQDNVLNRSKSYLFIGNVTDYEFLIPKSGCYIVVKGITIIGDGNTGNVKLFRELNDQCILPAYFSAQVKNSASSALNIILGVNEKLLVTSVGRGDTSESFIGVSYIEIDPQYE